PREFGPFGASGTGEVPLSAPHAAIINAIHNACGIRLKTIPATPDRILKALEEAKK
ncbi:MAG: hypothetical protein GX487_07930, partial [Acetomicrobium flavidum]|nr:hypothetical protein [Acetomicrobium flavidum]